MFCTACGSQQPDGAKFCTSCGAPMVASAQRPAVDRSSMAPPAGPREEPSQVIPPASVPRGVVRRRDGRGVTAAAAVLAALAVAAVIGVAAVLTDGFGLMADPQAPSKSDPSASEQGDPVASQDPAAPEGASSPDDPAAPEVRDATQDYTWAELSQISALISAAPSEDEAISIAARYHLCNEDGTLDGTQHKDLTLSDGTTVRMMVAGFNHDERADGLGAAGITLISRGVVGSRVMNANDATAGGWRDSDLRAWMNGELLDMLPDDVAGAVVPVVKMTNVVGETSDPGAVTATVDALWTPSYAELGGHMDIDDDDYDDVYNAEGEQYQLYEDLGVSWDTSNEILAISGVEYWWERTPDPLDGNYFMCVGDDGAPWYAFTPSHEFGVVLCFCV